MLGIRLNTLSSENGKTKRKPTMLHKAQLSHFGAFLSKKRAMITASTAQPAVILMFTRLINGEEIKTSSFSIRYNISCIVYSPIILRISSISFSVNFLLFANAAINAGTEPPNFFSTSSSISDA